MKRTVFCKVLMVAIAVLALYGMGNAGTFDLTGPFLNVGVSNTGGLIDDNFVAGIQFDKTGSGSFGGAGDILKPGTPFEFFTMGINGVDMGPTGYMWNGTSGWAAANPNYAISSYQSTPVLGFSSGTVGGLLITTTTTLVSGQSIKFDVNFVNFSGADMTVQYARGLDPDQDVNLFGSFMTNNSIGAGIVSAFGPNSLLSIAIQDLTGGGVPTIQAPGTSIYGWAVDLATLSVAQAAGNYGLSDSSINMYWDLGTIKDGSSKELTFQYNVSSVPLPPGLLLFAPGLLGLMGIRKRFRA